MICLIQNREEYNNDLRVTLMAFYPGVKIVTPENIQKKPEYEKDIEFTLRADFLEDRIELRIYDEYSQKYVRNYNVIADEEQYISIGGECEEEPCCISAFSTIETCCRDKVKTRNPLKLELYKMLSERTGKVLPWGSLTGVRPTKIAMEAMESGKSDEEIVEHYIHTYGASREKAEICVSVAHREKKIIDSVDCNDEYCLYIGIPFCPSRCLYCSFTSYPIAVYRDKVTAYLDAMEKEIAYVAEAYKHKKPVSIYIGGGTPSSISAEEIDRLCCMIEKSFDMSHVKEFTIEAGRPDSTTLDKLQVMNRHKVTRVSINPQTMNRETLSLIGRAHTPEQTVEAFYRAREAGCTNINMDLIVGLPGENVDMVSHTLDMIEELKPESLTVHSLAIKRAANLNQEMDKYRDKLASDINEQLSQVNKRAAAMGLNPYYLYRQKNIAGNLENVGFSKDGLECLYNILIMEERTDIIGIGAGSSSKLIRHAGEVCPGTGEIIEGTRIDRVENCKSVDDYITRIDEMIDRKRQGFY
jgi:oxygen-independent coproporphyrinogen-3 oxidase